MVAVQSTGCAPIVRAWDEGKEFAEFWDNAETISSGIRVPSALGDFLILNAIRESGGFAIAVTDEETLEKQNQIGMEDVLLLCTEGAATVAAYRNCIDSGMVDADEKAVMFNTATGLKYPMPPVSSRVDKENVDFSTFQS